MSGQQDRNIDILRRKFQASVRRLDDLANRLGAPENVIARELALAMSYAVNLMPGQFGAQGDHASITTRARIHGICASCDNDVTNRGDFWCAACNIKAEMEFGDEAGDTPPGGGSAP